MEKPTKYFSSIQEKRIAEYLGWDVVVGSGARDCHPGDVVSNDWLGECKTHVTPDSPIVFKSDVWDKLCAEALSKFKYPVLFVDDGSQKLNSTWCLFNYKLVCPPNSYLHTCEKIRIKKNAHFTNAELSSIYHDALANCSDNQCVIFVIKLNNKDVGIVPIFEFKHMFAEDI